MKAVLAWSSAAVFTLSAILALLLALSKSDGGFFPMLGQALGLVVLLAGITISFALNGLLWYFYGAPTWLRALTVVQAAPAIYCVFLLSGFLLSRKLDSLASDQIVSMRDAIEADDPDRLVKVQKKCGASCRERYTLGSQLLDAVNYRSHKVAQYLISHEHADAHYDLTALAPHLTLSTCEGTYLGEIQILPLAISRNDASMTRLLLPVSDATAQRSALWIAARLDRFELVQMLLQYGVPISIRGEVLDENQTLLVAAASGAALRVGRWLIQEKHMPVDALVGGPDPYQPIAPVHILFQESRELPDERVRAFLRMLRDHGADLDVPLSSGQTLLQEAIRTNDQRSAQLLVDFGAHAEGLSDSERKALKQLLTQSRSQQYYSEPAPDCVAAGTIPSSKN